MNVERYLDGEEINFDSLSNTLAKFMIINKILVV